MGAPQSIETDITTVLASPNPLPTTPRLPRSAQEHAGAVYAAPIPTSQIANQHSDFGPFACLSQNSWHPFEVFPRVYAHGYTRNREVYRWFRQPETLSTHLRVGCTISKPIQPTELLYICLLYTSPSPRDVEESRMPSSA